MPDLLSHYVIKGITGKCVKFVSILTERNSYSFSQGWEETVDAAISNLLRTCLSKTSKDQMVNPGELEMPSEGSKLKKHITLMTDRLAKGGRLFLEGQEPGNFFESSPLLI